MLDLLFDTELSMPQAVLIMVFSLVVIFVSLAIHEFAHAFAAYKMGDDTAKMAGRLTLNPLKHIDPMGFFWFLLIGVGWAKPVPINPIKFKKYRTGTRIVSIAGILANFLLGLLAAILYAILGATVGFVSEAMFYVSIFLQYFMIINSALVLFNLLPVYPLDGFTFITTFMKGENKYIKFNLKYGSLILIGLLLFSGIFSVMFPIDLLDFYLTIVYNFVYTPITWLGVL
ncbi:MAG: site-2 protease family protein [Clostridia bacterium]